MRIIKTTLCGLTVMALALQVKAQQPSASQTNNLSSSNVLCSLPVERSIKGGTKFVVEFDGHWNADQKEAFLDACRVWEEVIPSTFPIRIMAVMDSTEALREAEQDDILSEVICHTKNVTPSDCWGMSAPISQTKAVVYKKLCNLGASQYWKELLDSSYFVIPEIDIIVYEFKNMDDIYSYETGNVVVQGKYNFMTTIMRHIGSGLGLNWRYSHVSNGSLIVDGSNLTPFEYVVSQSLSNGVGYDLMTWYQRATQGSLLINGGAQNYTIYAPQTWQPMVSLNYFMPQTGNDLSLLMRWDYSRGMSIHNISDASVTNMFDDLLKWEPMIAIGIGNSPEGGEITMGQSTNTQAVAPGGSISLNLPTNRNTSQNDSREQRRMNIRESVSNPVYEMTKLYHPNYYNGSIDNYGWTVSVQKNDGTWEAVYHTDNDETNLCLNENDIVLNDALDCYARSFDGHLKCRASYKSEAPDDYYVHSYYCLLKTLPQQVNANPAECRTIAMVEDDEFSKVIMVRIGNLAGAKRIFVDQLDDWATIPYTYEVTDFSKGCFEATVDVEFPTVFTIVAYDEYNRYTTKTITYTPDPDELGVDLNFKSNRNYIEIKPAHTRRGADELVLSGEIISISPENVTRPMWGHGKLEGNRIDISGLKQGTYVLNVTDVKGKKHTYKFCK